MGWCYLYGVHLQSFIQVHFVFMALFTEYFKAGFEAIDCELFSSVASRLSEGYRKRYKAPVAWAKFFISLKVPLLMRCCDGLKHVICLWDAHYALNRHPSQQTRSVARMGVACRGKERQPLLSSAWPGLNALQRIHWNTSPEGSLPQFMFFIVKHSVFYVNC